MSRAIGATWNACIFMCSNWMLCEHWPTFVFLTLDVGNHPMVMLSDVVIIVYHMYDMIVSKDCGHNFKESMKMFKAWCFCWCV